MQDRWKQPKKRAKLAAEILGDGSCDSCKILLDQIEAEFQGRFGTPSPSVTLDNWSCLPQADNSGLLAPISLAEVGEALLHTLEGNSCWT